MRRLVCIFAVATLLCAVLPAADSNEEIAQEILALEHKAMDGWLEGNPDPTLAVSDNEITYFHAMTNGRLDGLAAVRELYERYRGSALFDSYEIVDPKVQGSGDTVVLSYILARHNGAVTSRWNATQVYQRTPQGWRVIHTHWSMTNPPRPSAP
jgi:hypothetical protein